MRLHLQCRVQLIARQRISVTRCTPCHASKLGITGASLTPALRLQNLSNVTASSRSHTLHCNEVVALSDIHCCTPDMGIATSHCTPPFVGVKHSTGILRWHCTATTFIHMCNIRSLQNPRHCCTPNSEGGVVEMQI